MDIISQLPEGCLSLIISFTSPKDACRSSLVSPIFKSASESDLVWEKFLPCDYKQVISQSLVIPSLTLNSMSKRDLYFHLCDNPIIIGNGNMSFSLDKPTGKKCMMIGARGLSIVWGDTPRYWQWKSIPDSRFSQVAELKLVWWLHAIANFETRALSPRTTYEAYLVFKLLRGLDEFRDRAVQLRVEFEGPGSGEAIGAFLDHSRNEHRPPPVPRDRGDGWKEVKMGELYNENGEDGPALCHLKETSCTRSWSGLIIEGVELRPKHE